MRLICPNCGAQYEVGDDVIPAAGRDVQCSNCGHTWFEQPGSSEAAEAGDFYAPPSEPTSKPQAHAVRPPRAERATPNPMPDTMPDNAAPQSEPVPVESHPDVPPQQDWDVWDDAPPTDNEVDVVSGTAPAPDAWQNIERVLQEADSDDSYRSDDNDSLDENGDDAPAPPAQEDARPLPRTRSTVSPQIAEILREEAAREEAARRADAEGAFESQPDLGLEAPLDREAQMAEEARRRMLRMRGDEAPAIGAPNMATRRELLPDIEEINSSLGKSRPRPETNQRNTDLEETARNRRGFRLGFSLVLVIAIFALLTYTNAPLLADRVPALAPMLESYVTAVDQGRLWLDIQVQAFLVRLEGADGVTPAATGTDRS